MPNSLRLWNRCGNNLSAIGWSNSVSAHHSITKKTIKPPSNILIIKASLNHHPKLSKTINQAMDKKLKTSDSQTADWTLKPSKTVLKQSLNPKWKTLQSHLKPHRHVRSPDLVLVNLNLQASEPKKPLEIQHWNHGNIVTSNVSNNFIQFSHN